MHEENNPSREVQVNKITDSAGFRSKAEKVAKYFVKGSEKNRSSKWVACESVRDALQRIDWGLMEERPEDLGRLARISTTFGRCS